MPVNTLNDLTGEELRFLQLMDSLQGYLSPDEWARFKREIFLRLPNMKSPAPPPAAVKLVKIARARGWRAAEGEGR